MKLAGRALHQAEQRRRCVPTVFHGTRLSVAEDAGPVVPNGGGDLGSDRARSAGAAHIVVAGTGYTGGHQLCRHQVPNGRPPVQCRLVRVRHR